MQNNKKKSFWSFISVQNKKTIGKQLHAKKPGQEKNRLSSIDEILKEKQFIERTDKVYR